MSDINEFQAHYLNKNGTFFGLIDDSKVVGSGAIRYLNDEICSEAMSDDKPLRASTPLSYGGMRLLLFGSYSTEALMGAVLNAADIIA
ncbi:MAG: hypothetical protein PUP93_22545 [Rhizonema sp. NSF051]|nr:hypothetical protein [Rhizonema sp. NSF051]